MKTSVTLVLSGYVVAVVWLAIGIVLLIGSSFAVDMRETHMRLKNGRDITCLQTIGFTHSLSCDWSKR